jgi:hypothetical protein
MSWDRRGYYYRSRKVGGKVRREYLGRGPIIEELARLHAEERADRERDRRALAEEAKRLGELDARVTELDELTELVARAAMAAAGFHRHHRGEWRRKRGQPKAEST